MSEQNTTGQECRIYVDQENGTKKKNSGNYGYVVGIVLRVILPLVLASAVTAVLGMVLDGVLEHAAIITSALYIIFGYGSVIVLVIRYRQEYDSVTKNWVYLLDERDRVYLMEEKNLAYCKTFTDCLRMAVTVERVKKELPMKKVEGTRFLIVISSAVQKRKSTWVNIPATMKGYTDIVSCMERM